MRLLLCLSCLLGFASLPTVKTSTSPAAPANLSATIPSVKPVSLPTVTQGPTTGGAATKPSSGTSAGVETLKPSTTASVVAVLSNNAPTTPSAPQVLPTSGSATVITTSSSGPQVITGTVATVSKPTESASKFVSPAAAASLSASTAAALNPSSSTNRGTLGTSAPDGSKQSAVHTQHSPTSAGSNTPGSSLTVQSMTSALLLVPAGPHSTAGPTLSQETSEPTPKNVVIDPALEATSTVSGSTIPVRPPEKPGSTISSASVSSTPAKIIWTSTLPGDQPRVSSTPSTSQAPGPIPSAGFKTMNFPGIELTCFLQEFPNQSLIIQTQGNKPTLCKDETVKHEKELLAVLCETVNQGFKFSENKDNCTVKLAYNTDQPHKFAVLEVSVKANAAAEDMDKVLKGRSEELKKLGFLLDKSGIESLETYEDKISIPLIITIVSLAAALLLIAAIYSCCHQGRRHRKDQRLTEELQTMENGYHDNPTLEVMETSPEMQEKKPGLNGDLGDSWIVPMDNLMKEDMDDEEEDTHL